MHVERTNPVLIVGAGPVGLATAAFVARFGLAVRIIDSNSSPTSTSKALVLWRRSLLTLDPLFPRAFWETAGTPLGQVYFGDCGRLIAAIDLSNPAQPVAAYASPQQGPPGEGSDAATATPADEEGKQHELPAGILLPQSDTEAVLIQHLKDKHEINVERNTSLISFTVKGGSQEVDCELLNKEKGETVQVTASILIGCDGAHSTVRKLLNTGFLGSTLPEQHFLLADVQYEVEDGINPRKPHNPVERSVPSNGLFITTSPAGTVGIIPLGSGENKARILLSVGHQGAGEGGCVEPSLGVFQAALLANTRLQWRLTAADWLSTFNVNERQVPSYVHAGGRVLLAGDAAHIHSPAGGQGLNTGVQDAANLAWKVALVASGKAADPEKLLGSYQEERWPVGASVIRMSGFMLRANTIRSPLLRALRVAVMSTLFCFAAVRQRLAASLAEDDIVYTSSSLLQIGAAAPAGAAAKGLTAAARAVFGSCKSGAAFPDVSVVIQGRRRPATDMLRAGTGTFGTLVIMPDAVGADEREGGAEGGQGAWPRKWGDWPLHLVQVGGAGQGLVVEDRWCLLLATLGLRADVGVLVRPDGMVAAVGGPREVAAWLDAHVGH